MKHELKILIAIVFMSLNTIAQIDNSIATSAQLFNDDYPEVTLQDVMADYTDSSSFIKNIQFPKSANRKNIIFGCFNPDKNKVYFYTKSFMKKSRVYIYNIATSKVDVVKMGENISDMFVYAPDENTNRVYVSLYSDTRIIKSIDGETNTINPPGNGNWIYLDDNQEYCTSMYLAPNNKLYCMAGMDNIGSNEAGLQILDANNNFAHLQTYHYTDISGVLDGDFCYNEETKEIYAIAWDMDPSQIYGKFTIINGETNAKKFEQTIGNAPTQIVCSPVTNKVYIKYAGLNYLTTYYDGTMGSISVGNTIWDIEYDPVRDLVFVLHAESDKHKLGFVNDDEFTSGIDLPSSSCKIAYNPGNSGMYVYVAHNDANNEEAEMWLCMLEDYTSLGYSFATSKIPLENRHTYKFCGRLYNNDILFDHNTNQIYVANGGHSNISVLGYNTLEPLVLHSGYNWMSVPRLNRTSKKATYLSNVFNYKMFSPDYTAINIEYNNISKEIPAGENNKINGDFGMHSYSWSYTDDTIKEVISTRGYVISTEPKVNRVLLMDGTVEDPETKIDLFCKKENWIGYFIPEKQNVFDALSNIIDDVYHIQMEDCNCWRHNYPISNSCGTKDTKDYSPGTWICDGTPVIDYAQMVKISPELDIDDFQWNYSGSTSAFDERPEVEYYDYEKSAGYHTFVIILDTTETIPTEIGAFVNDSCVGATSVLPSDTVVVLSAYLEIAPGDSLTFEQYYGSTKMTNKSITDYYVKNKNTHTYNKRVIYTGEEQEAFIISFIDNEQTQTIENVNELLVMYPNPATDNMIFSINIDMETYVQLSVYDINGRLVKVIADNNMAAGTTNLVWNIKDSSSLPVSSGAYYVNLVTNNKTITKKLLIN